MKYEKAELFEKKVGYIYWIAMGAAVLHKATAWLGAGTLTWATVVLMGGFASQISLSDFKSITVLVLLVVALLALSLFSIKLIARKSLYTGSINPARFTYRDHRLYFVTLIDGGFLIVQVYLISDCLFNGFTEIYRSDFKTVHFYSSLFTSAPASTSNSASSHDPSTLLDLCLQNCFSNSSTATMAATCAKLCLDSTSDNNLLICLYFFFFLLNATSICAAVCLVYGWIVKRRVWGWLVGDFKLLSLRRYHDEVLSRAMNLGLAEADDFDSRVFLLRALGEDLMMRNIGPLEVRRQNLEVIEYLYNHPQGSEMVYHALASENTLLQQAAANIVGFWAESDLRLDSQLELLCRVGDKLGLPGKAAEGAANSFSALAKQWASRPIEPSPLLSVCVSQSRAAAGRGGGAAAPSVGGAAAASVGGAVVAADGAAATVGGEVAAAAAVADDAAAGGGATNGGTAAAPCTQYGYNVVDKVIDIVLQKLTPTLLIYVRALDSFFISASVREHVSKTGIGAGLEEKLIKGIIKSNTHSMQARTRFMAFSVLCRLRSSDGTQIKEEAKESMEELLCFVDDKFIEQQPAAKKIIIWVEEADRYRAICEQLGKPYGAWLAHIKITGKDLPH